MTPFSLPSRLLAADAFEAMIEAAIIGPKDLYDLDGDTLLISRNGLIETCYGELYRSF